MPAQPAQKQPPLPDVYSLTIVRDPDKSGMISVVLSMSRGDTVLKRRVIPPACQSMDEALALMNQIATRVYYFNEGPEEIQP